jgi:hypothetical protein
VIQALAHERAHEPLGKSIGPHRQLHPVWMTGTDVCWISITTSTCRKSHARMPDAWAARNCRQVGDARRGAGPSPAHFFVTRRRCQASRVAGVTIRRSRKCRGGDQQLEGSQLRPGVRVFGISGCAHAAAPLYAWITGAHADRTARGITSSSHRSSSSAPST